MTERKISPKSLKIIGMGISVLAMPVDHADSVLGIELSPITCKLNPQMASLRQCIEGNPMTVNFYRVYHRYFLETVRYIS